MKLIRTALTNLPRDIAIQTQALLRNAYRDDPEPEYNYGPQLPDVVVLLLDGNFIAGHLAAYTRDVTIDTAPATIGLIGGVAVAETHRLQGHARAMVAEAHRYFVTRAIAFSVLFAASPAIYRSSGYRDMTNTTRFMDHDGTWKDLVYRDSMVAELANAHWPSRPLDLCGPTV
ncbi:GNAT family N-acetyltransferase [Bradyrhizobium prioriisuperbiae]|uniref:GNAT family N-acetyltransferase n=1 Tax=Bradyrhizobium prioriisuperbiae TaxID=2854389 RepID=UPI0028E7D29F|nr:GNAT family N-acetyltransferase [Bradyrhizobium prioritasuperba]